MAGMKFEGWSSVSRTSEQEPPSGLDLTPAFRIALEVHGHQKDKAGEPYLWHVFRVAMRMETDEERVVALLHDAIEDAGTRAQEVARAIYDAYGVAVGDAVVALTKLMIDQSFDIAGIEQDDYLRYIRRLAQNPVAVRVKLADLMDNADPERLAKLGPKEAARLSNKYDAGYRLLCREAGLTRCEEVSLEELRRLYPTAASSPDSAPDEQP